MGEIAVIGQAYTNQTFSMLFILWNSLKSVSKDPNSVQKYLNPKVQETTSIQDPSQLRLLLLTHSDLSDFVLFRHNLLFLRGQNLVTYNPMGIVEHPISAAPRFWISLWWTCSLWATAIGPVREEVSQDEPIRVFLGYSTWEIEREAPPSFF